jgi:hypothetical protein
MGADQMYDKSGDQYWAVSYQFEVDFDSQVRAVLDAGFEELNDLGQEPPLVKILAEVTTEAGASKSPKEFSPISTPAKLDGAGVEMTRSPITPVPSGVYIEYLTLFPVDWETSLDLTRMRESNSDLQQGLGA